MPAIPIVGAIAGALAGAGAVAGAIAQRKAVAAQKRDAAKQERVLKQQERTAREGAALEGTRTDTGAKVKLGTTEDAAGATKGGKQSSNRTGTVTGTIGGVSTSSRLGI